MLKKNNKKNNKTLEQQEFLLNYKFDKKLLN